MTRKPINTESAPDSSPKTQKAKGNWGEDRAAEHLIAKGYAIVERNWHLNHLEIDIIAQDGDTLAFVEVKTRAPGAGDPLEAIDSRKIRNMANAANTYISSTDTRLAGRFDIIGIVGSPATGVISIEHLPDAFDPPLTHSHGKSRR